MWIVVHELFLNRFAASATSDAFARVITIFVSSAKETKNGFKIQTEQLPLKN